MNTSVTPYAGKRHWVQMVLGAGVMRFSVSGDGVHWSPVFQAAGVQSRPCTHVGLVLRRLREETLDPLADGPSPCARRAHVAGFGESRRSVPQELVKLKTVPAAAPGSAPQPAVPLAKCGSVEQWQQHVAASRPGDVAADAWLRACAISTLVECPPQPLYQAVVLRLLDEASAGPEKVDAKLRAFDDAGLLLNTPDGNTASQLGGCFVRLGQALLRQGEPAPFSAVSAGLLRARAPHRIAVGMPWEELLVAELVPLMYDNRWKAVDDVVRRIRLWQDPRRIMGGLPGEETPLAELSDWASASVPRRGGVATGERAGGAGQWRPLLSPSLSREAYTAVAELEAAIRGQGYAEGCQLIVATPNPLSLGLAPDATDRRLMVAFPTAVRLIVDRTPALRKTLETSFLKIGRLRLQGAVNAGDQVAVETVAVQFPGTEVAVDAHQWLGDRALSAGRFAHAIAQYRQAWPGASAAQRVDLAARARLAGALQGREMSSPGEAAGEDRQRATLAGGVRAAGGRVSPGPRGRRRGRRRLVAVVSRAGQVPGQVGRPHRRERRAAAAQSAVARSGLARAANGRGGRPAVDAGQQSGALGGHESGRRPPALAAAHADRQEPAVVVDGAAASGGRRIADFRAAAAEGRPGAGVSRRGQRPPAVAVQSGNVRGQRSAALGSRRLRARVAVRLSAEAGAVAVPHRRGLRRTAWRSRRCAISSTPGAECCPARPLWSTTRSWRPSAAQCCVAT